MAGRPPHIHVVDEESETFFVYRECRSVPYASVRRALTALKKAGLVPADATVSREDGFILIGVTRPSGIPADRRKREYKWWIQPLWRIVHTMNICIQSERAPKDLVHRVGQLKLVA